MALAKARSNHFPLLRSGGLPNVGPSGLVRSMWDEEPKCRALLSAATTDNVVHPSIHPYFWHAMLAAYPCAEFVARSQWHRYSLQDFSNAFPVARERTFQKAVFHPHRPPHHQCPNSKSKSVSFLVTMLIFCRFFQKPLF